MVAEGALFQEVVVLEPATQFPRISHAGSPVAEKTPSTAVFSEVEPEHQRHIALAQEALSARSMTVDAGGSITVQTAESDAQIGFERLHIYRGPKGALALALRLQNVSREL